MFRLSRNTIIAALTMPFGLAQAQELPDGSGNELVEAACVACHEIKLITGFPGFTHGQ